MADRVIPMPDPRCTEGVEVDDEDGHEYCAHGNLLCPLCHRHTVELPYPEKGEDCLSCWCSVHGRVAWSCP
jgi:hypothetical protein